MNYEEFERLLKDFDVFTLESIGILLSYIDDNKANLIFNKVFNEKYEESRDEFEGMNEYNWFSKNHIKELILKK